VLGVDGTLIHLNKRIFSHRGVHPGSHCDANIRRRFQFSAPDTTPARGEIDSIRGDQAEEHERLIALGSGEADSTSDPRPRPPRWATGSHFQNLDRFESLTSAVTRIAYRITAGAAYHWDALAKQAGEVFLSATAPIPGAPGSTLSGDDSEAHENVERANYGSTPPQFTRDISMEISNQLEQLPVRIPPVITSHARMTQGIDPGAYGHATAAPGDVSDARHLSIDLASGPAATGYRLSRSVRTLVKRASASSLALAYLLAITLAESITNLVDPLAGVALHLIVFGVLIAHAATERRSQAMRLLLSLSLVPLIRVVSLGLPLGTLGLEYWYILTGIPLMTASVAAVYSLNLTRHEIGFCLPRPRQWLLTALIAGSGILIGLIEFRILDPIPTQVDRTLAESLFFAGALLFGTGVIEELIFRGILQTSVIAVFGIAPGIIYVSLLFGLMHMGHGATLQVAFVFVVGILFGYARHRTGSLLGVIAAHTLANVVFFIILS
jgi:uncharacterized protein